MIVCTAMRRARWAMAGFSAIVALIAGWLAISIESYVSGWSFAMPGTTDSVMGPSTFPRLVLVITTLLAVANLVTLFGRASGTASSEKDEPLVEGALTPLRVTATLVVCIAYLVALSNLGFVVSSILAILIGATLVGWRQPAPLLILALCLPPLTWLTFRFGMKVILP